MLSVLIVLMSFFFTDRRNLVENPAGMPQTSHLFSDGRKPETAFQRYRNSRLGGEFHSEITGRSLSDCLDECLRQTSFQCRSSVYSERFMTCRLSRYNQNEGMRIIYDADYDYYENLMRKYFCKTISQKFAFRKHPCSIPLNINVRTKKIYCTKLRMSFSSV